MPRSYSLVFEQDLFGPFVLVWNRKGFGTNPQENVQEFPGNIKAGQALEAVVQANSSSA